MPFAVRRAATLLVAPSAALFLLTLFCAGARAQLLFTLSPDTQNAAPGQTVTFAGTLTNRFADRIYLNGLSGQFTNGTAGTVDTDSFFTYVPAFLESNASYTGNIFNVSLNNSATIGTTYTGVVNIEGGSLPSDLQTLATRDFNVVATTVTPAPPAGEVFAIFGAAATGFGVWRRKKERMAKTA